MSSRIGAFVVVRAQDAEGVGKRWVGRGAREKATEQSVIGAVILQEVRGAYCLRRFGRV